MIHPVINKLLSNLSRGQNSSSHSESEQQDAVTKIARVYELARNAMEYRADHLVRRAAIERILRRQIIFFQDASKLTRELLQEMRWAGYINDDTQTQFLTEVLASFLQTWAQTTVNKDWLLGLISAHVEELLNHNRDYAEFTTFAFNVLRSRIEVDDPNIDLWLYVAVDRVFSQADEAGVSYHLYLLNPARNLEETYLAYKNAFNSKPVNTLSVWVRKQMGPIMLLRDIYFSAPSEFSNLVQDREQFAETAKQVLTSQLKLIRQRMNTATFRSLLYVFLTKMILGLLIEAPLEIIFRGQIHYFSLLVNLIVPIGFMWLIVANIHLPSRKDQEKMLERCVEIVFAFDTPANQNEKLVKLTTASSPVTLGIFYFFYILLFGAVFYFIYWSLSKLGFSFISKTVFVFFLSVVTFFAYRIRQIATLYVYQPNQKAGSLGWDIFTLPVVTLGNLVSRGVSNLNFLVFIFDFVLEAPFKIILGFLDSWGRFLSSKRDELVG